MEHGRVGAAIQRLRETKAWTQEHLAEVARVSVRTVQRAEEGSLSAETLKAIAAAFDVPVEVLTVAPAPFPKICAVLYYDAPEALDWLSKAFDFVIAMKIPGPDGKILHAELVLDDARIIVGQPIASRRWTTPRLSGVRTQSLYVLVNDPDEHCRKARTAGAVILVEPENVHGQRRYLAEDCEGHHWWFFAALAP